MQLKNRLGELMAEYHRKTGERLTQEKLRNETGVSQSTISSYVTNTVTRYDVNTVLRFLEFFGVGISDFFVVVPSNDEVQPDQAVGVLALAH